MFDTVIESSARAGLCYTSHFERVFFSQALDCLTRVLKQNQNACFSYPFSCYLSFGD
jgi:hypothetical protein